MDKEIYCEYYLRRAEIEKKINIRRKIVEGTKAG